METFDPDNAIADAVGAKLMTTLMKELEARDVPKDKWDDLLINTLARMTECGYAVRQINYPKRLFQRLITRGKM